MLDTFITTTDQKLGLPRNIKFIASTLPNSIRIFFTVYFLSDANYITILRKALLVELIVPKIVLKFPIFKGS
jgi:hypothetical protein